jgi:NAD-dependent dihydropyrimidine dehydrogenase PreA subunit
MGIKIYHKKCRVNECNDCLKACHKKVFGKFPTHPRKNKISTRFKLEIVFPEYCEEGCKKCQESCPVQAIIVGPKVKSNDLAHHLLTKVLLRLKFSIMKLFIRELYRRIVPK